MLKFYSIFRLILFLRCYFIKKYTCSIFCSAKSPQDFNMNNPVQAKRSSGWATPHSRQVKAESLIIIRIGQRPTNRNVCLHQALKGRNQDDALSGLMLVDFVKIGRCPILMIIRLSALTKRH